MNITRRDFIRLTLSLALLPPGTRAVSRDTTDLWLNDDGKFLSDIVYQLFPHAQLSKDVYEQVAQQLDDKIMQSAELTAMLDDAIGVMAAQSQEQWLALPAHEKVAALEKIQRTPFFQFVRNESLNGVYRSPLTWELLGYEGSSLEFGGYINRGLNDIDWLPE